MEIIKQTIKRNGRRITPVEQILEKIKAEGRFIEDDGSFGQTTKRAQQKLEKYQLRNPFRMRGPGPVCQQVA